MEEFLKEFQKELRKKIKSSMNEKIIITNSEQRVGMSYLALKLEARIQKILPLKIRPFFYKEKQN